MIIELHDNFSNVQKIKATRVVVKTDYGDPIVLAIQVDNNQYLCSHVEDSEFKTLLSALGINKSLIIEEIKVDNSNEFTK